jgi:hypothetical protein
MCSSFTPLRTSRQCWMLRVVSPATNISVPAAHRRRRSSVSITAPKVLFSCGIKARGMADDTELNTSVSAVNEGSRVELSSTHACDRLLLAIID